MTSTTPECEENVVNITFGFTLFVVLIGIVLFVWNSIYGAKALKCGLKTKNYFVATLGGIGIFFWPLGLIVGTIFKDKQDCECLAS